MIRADKCEFKLLKPAKQITFDWIFGLRLRPPTFMWTIQICCKHKQAVRWYLRGTLSFSENCLHGFCHKKDISTSMTTWATGLSDVPDPPQEEALALVAVSRCADVTTACSGLSRKCKNIARIWNLNIVNTKVRKVIPSPDPTWWLWSPSTDVACVDWPAQALWFLASWRKTKGTFPSTAFRTLSPVLQWPNLKATLV